MNDSKTPSKTPTERSGLVTTTATYPTPVLMMSTTNDDVLPCTPASPRRSQVPGPESVKYVTEDCERVGTQAPSVVNVTGLNNVIENSAKCHTPKLIQQTFHKSMFETQTRSQSLNDLLITIQDKPDYPTPAQQCKSSQISKFSWQRFPALRKRGRSPDSPSPTSKLHKKTTTTKGKQRQQDVRPQNTSQGSQPIPTNNSFTGLDVDVQEQEQLDKQNSKPARTLKQSKPPPIILYGIDNLQELSELIQEVMEKKPIAIK